MSPDGRVYELADAGVGKADVSARGEQTILGIGPRPMPQAKMRAAVLRALVSEHLRQRPRPGSQTQLQSPRHASNLPTFQYLELTLSNTRPISEYSRQELYDLIWSTPAVKLATDFGISNVAIAKRCKHRSVPRPPRGYWAKVAAGRKPRKTPLPPTPDELFKQAAEAYEIGFGKAAAKRQSCVKLREVKIDDLSYLKIVRCLRTPKDFDAYLGEILDQKSAVTVEAERRPVLLVDLLVGKRSKLAEQKLAI